MRHTFQVQAIAALLAAAAVLSFEHRLLAADATSPAPATRSFGSPTPGRIYRPDSGGPIRPQAKSPAAPMLSPQEMAAAKEKLRNLGSQIGRALDVAVRLLSGNEVDFVSRNKTNLLSGNAPEILSGNKPNLLSDNKMAVMSRNSFSMFSNIKVEIHIYNNNNGNNNNVTGNTAQPPRTPGGPGLEPIRAPSLKK